MTLSYTGRDQGGVEREGFIDTDNPVVPLRMFWPHGWRQLTVRDTSGTVVAAIGKSKGRRCWSALLTTDPNSDIT